MVIDYIKNNCSGGESAVTSGFWVTADDLAKAKYAHIRKRDTSADSGKTAHAWIEAHIKGENPPQPDDRDAQKSIKAFLKWEDEHNPTYLASERVLYSRQYDYCGTNDTLCLIGGKRTVLDFKTGKPDSEYNATTKRYTGKVRPRLEHLLQDAAYDQCMYEEDGEYAEQYAVLYLAGSNYHYFTSDRTEALREAFLCVLKMSRLLKDCEWNNKYERYELQT